MNKLSGKQKPIKALPAPSPEMDRWRVKDALSTVMRAKEIEKDPQLRREVKKMAREEAKKMMKVCG